MDDDLRKFVPLAFADDPEERQGEVQQYGNLSQFVPLAFENDTNKPEGFDARADEAGREIADRLKSRGRFARISDGIANGVSGIFRRRAEREAAEEQDLINARETDFGAVEDAFRYIGAPAAGTVEAPQVQGTLQDIAPKPAPDLSAAGVMAAETGMLPPQQIQQQMEAPPTPEPFTPIGGPPVLDENQLAALQQEQQLQQEIQAAFDEQELLGSRRLGALKRGRQIATAGLRDAPGMLGIVGRTLKPEDSLTEKLIDSGVIRLTGGQQGIRIASMFAPTVVEVLLTKKVARWAAPQLGGKAGQLADLVGRTAAGSRAGGAVTGALEGLPTDLAIAIDNHDVGELGLGVAIGAITGAIFPGGGKVAQEIVDLARKDPETVAQGLADMLAESRRLGDGGMEQELEIAMAQAVRDGDDMLAGVFDDAIERALRDPGSQANKAGRTTDRRSASQPDAPVDDALPTPEQLAARRLEPEAPARPEPAEREVVIDRSAAPEAGPGELPTAREAAARRERAAPEVVGDISPRDARTQGAREAARDVPTEPRTTGRAAIQLPANADDLTRGADRRTAEGAIPEGGERRSAESADRREAIRSRISSPEAPQLRRELQGARETTARQERELEGAFTDQTTGLKSANAYQEARGRLDADPEVTQTAIDLVNLKAVNEIFDEAAGTEFIARAGRIVGEVAQEFGIDPRMVFRAGGDEFVIGARNADEATQLGEEIQRRLGRTQIGDTNFETAARFGVGNTRAEAEAAVSAAKKAETGPRFRSATEGRPDIPRSGGAVASDLPPGQAAIRQSPEEMRRSGNFEEADIHEAEIRQKLDDFFSGRGTQGFVHEDILRAVAAPVAGAAIGGTIGGTTATDREDAPGRALAGATAGLLMGLGPAGARALGDNSKWARTFLTPGGALPGSVRRFGREAQQEIRSALARTSGAISESERIIKNSLADVAEARGQSRANVILGGANPFHGLSDDVNSAISDFMKGDVAALARVPDELRVPIGNMREAVDDYSRAFLKEGIVEGELAIKFDERLGAHLTRSYKIFDDTNWEKNAPKYMGEAEWERTKNAFKSWYRSEFPTTPPEAMEGILKDFLSVGDDLNPIQAIANGKLGRLNTKVLERRREIPVEIRNLWGEHNDPMVNFARTISNQAGYIANYRWMKEFRENGLGRGFFFDPKADRNALRPADFTAEIAGEGSGHMSVLGGLRTTPEIAQAYARQFSNSNAIDNVPLRAILALSTTSKVMKTVGSHVTQIRNLVSNAGFALANGYFTDPMFLRAIAPSVGAGAVGGAIGGAVAPEGRGFEGAAIGASAGISASVAGGSRSLLKDLKIGGILNDAGIRIPGTEGVRVGEREWFDKLTRYGVIGDNARATELAKALKSVGSTRLARFMSNPVMAQQSGPMRSIRTMVGAAPKLYAVEDDVWKVVAFSIERNRYANAFAKHGINLSEERLDRLAADIVRDTFPTYSQTPEAIKQLGRIGGFVSFPAEVFRTIHSSIRQIEKDLSHPATRQIAAGRIMGLIAAGTASAAMAATSRKLNNVTKEEEMATREFVRPWSQNATFVHRQPIKDGKFAVVDMSYFDPYAYVTAPLASFMRGENWEEAAADVVSEAASPWVAANPLFSTIIREAQKNQETGAADIGSAVIQSVTPGAVDQYLRALTGRSSSLRPVDQTSEAMALATGLRGDEQDIRESMRFFGLDFNAEMTRIRGTINRAESRGGVTSRLRVLAGQSPETQMAALDRKTQGEVIEAFRTMSRKVKAARVLGLSPSEIDAILKEARVSKANRQLIMAAAFAPPTSNEN